MKTAFFTFALTALAACVSAAPPSPSTAAPPAMTTSAHPPTLNATDILMATEADLALEGALQAIAALATANNITWGSEAANTTFRHLHLLWSAATASLETASSAVVLPSVNATRQDEKQVSGEHEDGKKEKRRAPCQNTSITNWACVNYGYCMYFCDQGITNWPEYTCRPYKCYNSGLYSRPEGGFDGSEWPKSKSAS